MMLSKEIETLLNENDWVVECESPFEIRHKDGGAFASGLAAELVVDALKKEEVIEKSHTVLFWGRFGGYQSHTEPSLEKLVEWIHNNTVSMYVESISVVKTY